MIREDVKARTVLYLAVHNQAYPRNRSMREQLTEAGYKIEVIPTPSEGGYLSRMARMCRAAVSIPGEVTVIVLAEFSIQYFPVAYLLSKVKRATLVVDWFVGMYETNVEDWRRFPPSSPKAFANRFMDWFACWGADLVTTDTEVRADRLRGWRRRKGVFVVPVGAPRWAKPDRRTLSGIKAKTLLYYGPYIPLHGVDTIMKAFARLDPAWRLTLIGNGERRPQSERLAVDLNVMDRCHFMDSVPEEALAGIIAQHEIVLGIFGTSNKAATVIPNKVWQALCMGAPVITRESAAYHEIGSLLSHQLRCVPAADEYALTAAVEDVARTSLKSYPKAAAVLQTYVSGKNAQWIKSLNARGAQ